MFSENRAKASVKMYLLKQVPIYHHVPMMKKKLENLEFTARFVIKTSHSLK